MTSRNVLLVEGPDDRHFIHHLRLYYGISEGGFDIKSKDGVDRLLDTLDVELDASELERLGIIVDVNGDFDARWDAVRNRLVSLGYPRAPKMPDLNGTVVSESNRPAVGVWLMPNNEEPGFLEHFVALLIPADELWEIATEAVEAIPENVRRFSTTHKIKAQVHTWLAWQDEPGRPIGQALTKRYLNADTDNARALVDWIRRLFNL